jgi:hypothetical protein
MRRAPSAASFVLALCLTGCATGVPAGARARASSAHRPLTPPAQPRAVPWRFGGGEAPALGAGSRVEAVSRARALLGHARIEAEGRRYESQCTGVIRAVYTPMGLALRQFGERGDNGVTALYRYALARGEVFSDRDPSPGDWVFFRETYDLNRDGRINDGLTHVGVVEQVEPDGTVLFIHHVARGVVRYRMNLKQPGVRVDPATGQPLNDYLRAASAGQRGRLTGELFAAYASVLPSRTAVARR